MKPPLFISIQGSYNQLELALYQNTNCLQIINEKNIKASSFLIPLIDKILKSKLFNLNNLDFICIDQGPGAFTSLRVTITTVNGISFASKIPLIGINGLYALSEETLIKIKNSYANFAPQILITLLNAYNEDVYFLINKLSDSLNIQETICSKKTYQKIDTLLKELKSNFLNKKIAFVGNGAILYQNLIENEFKKNAIIINQDVCSAKQISKIALHKWSQSTNKKENFKYKLSPLYLKSQTFAIRPIKN
ncbi:tRNA (adenosine(37)-N6)-threonylcarbamoyltransferase complex dimerization subunit type 1 TsaB [Candidatus Dependentiae bacterium]|nr:tRNA (adenosine(37)-N6)-threonylcarbamoyltransferase complex dimerization subunit type 1 TsaB [Candidatus Dependentiae bacterium]